MSLCTHPAPAAVSDDPPVISRCEGLEFQYCISASGVASELGEDLVDGFVFAEKTFRPLA